MAVPSAPTSLVATVGDNQLSIAFTPGASTPAILRYEARLNTGSYYPVGEMASPIVVKGLTNGVSYQVYIRAVNADGNGASANVTATPIENVGTANNGWADANDFANAGMAYSNFDWNDPDD